MNSAGDVTNTQARPRVAVVTGGSRGLGALLSESLLEEGWSVAAVSRSASTFVERAAVSWPDTFLWLPGDLTDPVDARTTTQTVARRFGRIDALVNNMGALRQELFVTLTSERAREQVETNLLGPLFMSQASARIMVRQGGGTILTISSINAIRGHSGVAVYSAAKAGLDGLTRSLARELGPQGVRINSIVPGYFPSDLSAGVSPSDLDRILRRTPLGRLGTPADVVSASHFLLSPDASFITGQTLTIDGGLTC